MGVGKSLPVALFEAGLLAYGMMSISVRPKVLLINPFSSRIVNITAAIAYVVLTQLTDQFAGAWFPLSKMAFQNTYQVLKSNPWPLLAPYGALVILACISATRAVWEDSEEMRDKMTQQKDFKKVVIGAPVIEEAIFRGLLQGTIQVIQTLFFSQMAETALNKSCRVALQALLFAYMHGRSNYNRTTNIDRIFNMFIVGLTFGYYKERTGNLWIGYGAHALQNTMVSLVGLCKLP